MPPSIDIVDLGKGAQAMRFAREAHDKMGALGMAEIYLCLEEQFPEMFRQDLPLDKIHEFLKELDNDIIPAKFLKIFKMNISELLYALNTFYDLNPCTLKK